MTEQGNGTKLSVGMAALAALLGAIVAITRPMDQRISQLERSIDKFDTQLQNEQQRALDDASLLATLTANVKSARETADRLSVVVEKHTELDWHPTAGANHAAIMEAFREVETKFWSLDRLVQLLWEKIYGTGLPNQLERKP